MKRFKFKKIDAFASGFSTGNPAAAIYLDSFHHISEQEMQRIARELKGFVSEVGYVATIEPDRYKLRYFSAEKEVEFCGHATIAIMYDLLKGRRDASASGSKVVLETNKGILDVENRIAAEDCVYITAPVPGYSNREIGLDEICRALALRPQALNKAVKAGIVNAGNETLCVPVSSLDDLVSAAPDYEKLRLFCSRHGLDVVTLFTREVSVKGNRYRTRVFAAPFGYLEDPATGSGNAALGYHLLSTGDWSGDNMVLEQNNDKLNPNIIKLGTRTDGQGMRRVVFGGSAITRIEGYYSV